MDKTLITFNAPSNIAEQAENAGILTDETLTNFLVKELERLTKRKEFFEIMDQLAALEPRLTLEEIEAEIQTCHDQQNW